MSGAVSNLGGKPIGLVGTRFAPSRRIELAQVASAAGTVAAMQLYVQRDQPPGVPPLSLTGERTLPDVPEENYWFRRHLVVYEWIAARAHGRRIVDLACGEGYGSAVLASTAVSVVGVDANPEAFQHARLKYTGVRFERNMIELWTGDVDCVVFLQTIEHVQDPDAVLDHVRELIGPRGVAYVSTPNVLTLAPKGAERSGNPWHVREYRAQEYRELCERHFGSVDLLGLFHARKLRAHQWALEHAAWDAVHARLGITQRFYDRFTPAISTRDFALRRARLDRALDFLAVLRP
jgi:SAM-dependent methyltransferase